MPQSFAQTAATKLEALKQLFLCLHRDVAVWLCSDATIRQHNKDFRFISKSTDVLSFAAHSVSLPQPLPLSYAASHPLRPVCSAPLSLRTSKTPQDLSQT